MKSVLVGNGIDIKLGGLAYTNTEIINRLVNNIRTKNYAGSIFNGSIANSEVEAVITQLKDELNRNVSGKYDSCYNTDDQVKLLEYLKAKYSIVTNLNQIGMEDLFIILKLFNDRYNDSEDERKATHDGLCWMLLDALYYEGNIQRIHENVIPRYKDYLGRVFDSYDSIITTNYDSTLEALSTKEVFHIHGSFDKLLDQYDSTTIIGKYYENLGKRNPVNANNKHIYCNGLMGFSGAFKEKVINTLNNGEFGIRKFLENYKTMNISDLNYLENLKTSNNPKDIFAYGIIKTITQNPDLTINDYPYDSLKNANGDLHIIGLSPYNDEHIWDCITKNSMLDNIIYFYHTSESRDMIASMPSLTPVTLISDVEFWENFRF